MTPAHLTLAAVAALAAAGAARRRGSFNLKAPPPGYHTSSFWAVEWSVLAHRLTDGWFDPDEDDEPPDAEYRLYHVTTAVDRVLAQGLKSRDQLRHQRGQSRSFGLGGGWLDTAPHLVSATVTLAAAERIYHALTTAVRAARGEIAPHAAAMACLRWTEFPDGDLWPSVEEALTEVYESGWAEPPTNKWAESLREIAEVLTGEPAGASDLPETAEGWLRYVQKNAAKIDQKWGYPDGAYNLIVALEEELIRLEGKDRRRREDDGDCAPIVSFTETANRMAHMDPSQIKIVALATRAKAEEVNPKECEARLRPEDVIVLGVVQPRSQT